MMISTVRVLLLLLALLAGGLASLWVDAQGQWRHIVWQAPATKAPDLKPPASLKLLASSAVPMSYASIQERPLFAPDRRPPPPPAAPPPPDPLADIQIYGVVSGSSSGILARVEGKMRRVKIDETLGEWTLKSVDGRDILFANGDQTRKLRLAFAPLGAPQQQPTKPVARQALTTAPTVGSPPGRNLQEEERESLRIRNEARAARGLPMVTR